MRYREFPHLSREAMADLANWTTLRAARALQGAGAVGLVDWQAPCLRGIVCDDGKEFEPELDLRSLTFVRARCACRSGQQGRVCEHALALVLEAQRQAAAEVAALPAPVAQSSRAPDRARSGTANQLSKVGRAASVRAEAVEGVSAAPAAIQTIKVVERGSPLRLRLHLPPNFADALGRGLAVLRLELVIAGKAHAPDKVFRGTAVQLTEPTRRAMHFLEELCGGRLGSVLQLKTVQLQELLQLGGADLEWWDVKEGRQLAETAMRERHPQLFATAAVERDSGPDLIALQPEVRRSRITSKQLELDLHRRAVAPPAAAPRPHVLLPETWMVVDGSPKFLAILLRDREHPCYRNCIDWLRAEGFQKEPSNGCWWLRDTHKVLNFLALRKTWLDQTYAPGYTDNFLQRTACIEQVGLQTEIAPAGSGFRIRVDMQAEGVDPADIRRAVLSGRHYLIAGERIFLIPPACLERFNEAARALSDDPGRQLAGLFEIEIPAAGLADAARVVQALDEELELPEDWTRRSTAIREVGRLEKPPLPDRILAQLRSYQLLGTAWLWHLFRNELGGVLADEMGLGKTIQAIGLLLCCQVDAHRDQPPALIVVPAGLLGNWRRELRTWAPELRVYLHHGGNRSSGFDTAPEADVWLTSYGTLRNDGVWLADREWLVVFADEAQHIKNRRTHAARRLRALRARARFVLTGTPIENSIDDLRSLFAFCLPGYLGQVPADARGEDRAWHERRHLEKAAPYILRRSKTLVAADLPEKIEQTIWCELSPEQEQRYAAVQVQCEQVMMQLSAAGASESRMRFTLLTELLRLRQVCADPGLIEEDFPLAASCKYRAFRELLEEAMDGGHRVLVFSQFVKLLTRLRGALAEDGIAYEYIDGATRDRLAVCDRFNRSPGIAVCFISLKAGGTGLNLTGADTVIHFDPWWNPAVEDQATDRAHRIGQTRTVTSYKLVTERTVEEKVLALQLKKAQLLRDLLDESAQQTAKVDLETLQSLLVRDAS